MSALTRALRALSLLAVVLGAPLVGACASAPDDESRVAAVGRIADVDANHGYLIVEFPTGRMFVTVDKRDLGKYIVGDDLRIDSYGRPLPPKPSARGR